MGHAREIQDAAVKRILGPNLPRLRRDDQPILLRRIEIDRADQGEAVENERQAAPGDRVRLVEKTQMEMGAFGGPGVAQSADARPGLHGVANLHSDAA